MRATNRRAVIQTMALAAGALAATPAIADADRPGQAITTLDALSRRLTRAPRRRDFKTVPMILDHPEQWDHEALSDVLAYGGTVKQAWDVTDLTGPWLNAMRNALNGQVFGFGHRDFLVVSATHGSANLALLDQVVWDKYALARIAPKGFERNSLILPRPAASADPHDIQNPHGVYSSENGSIPALQQRGAVFLSCHNALWELAAKLVAADANPDQLPVDALAADLTNHLVPGVVLMPGAVATLPELQRAGFAYAR